jgi:hypothetical protein
VTLVARLVTLFGLERPYLAQAGEDDQPPSAITPDPFELDDPEDP